MNILVESYKAGLLQKKFWMQNIIAGLIVGVVALPLSMAFAIASGAKPEQGLYTAIVAGVVVSLFGGSRVQIAGPTGAFIVILSGINAKYGMDGLQLATLMAGFILAFMGMARLGAVIKFIPSPVIIGFTTGIAVVIWVGQWPHFFGLAPVSGAHFHEKLWHLLQEFPHLSLETTGLAVFSLILVLFGNKLPYCKRVPTPLIALIFATLFQTYFHFDNIVTIGSAYGGIPRGFPSVHLPIFNLDRILELIGPAFTIAILGAIESLLSAVVADGMSGTRHHSNQELIGQGLANILSPLFGGIAATGAIARTATNIRNGGNSPLAGVVQSIVLLLIVLFLAPLAINIPLAVLAAILFVVAWNMSELKHFIKLLRCAPRADIVILLVTFMLTIFVDLVVAVNIGVIIAILHFLLRMAKSVDVQQQTEEQLKVEFPLMDMTILSYDQLIYSIDGPFFFGAVSIFEQAVSDLHMEPRVLIIRLRWVPFIDITGLHALEEVVINFQKRGVRVMLVGMNYNVKRKMRKAGLCDLIGEENLFDDLIPALLACNK